MNEAENIQQPARRRLAKGALAGTAVLASITSKNALGATYACTVSGQQSGNLSRAGEAVNCTDGARSLSSLQSDYSTGNKKKVEAPRDFGIQYAEPEKSGPANKKPTTPPLPSWALITQVLGNAPGLQFTKGGDPVLAQAAMVVYLNAARPNYHVDQARCIDLYNGATGSGMPLQNSNVVWSAARCASFLKMLAGLA